MSDTCLICDRIDEWKQGKNPNFIHEFEHSILVVGDHQFHRGYCLVLLKDHVRELHELPNHVQQNLFAELMIAGQAVHEAFEPWKLNYACYGNQAEHVHWHIFPRYKSDPDHRRNPWLHCDDFKEHRIDRDSAAQLAASVKTHLKRPDKKQG